MLGAQDIVINKLHIRAHKRAAQAVVHDLAQASWPLTLPSQLQDTWVLVRELRVQGKAPNLRRQTSEALESALFRAVDGGSAGAAQAAAVKFASLPDLLAFLLIDLALGTAAGKWYWARWASYTRQTRESAVAQLMVDNLDHLPTVISRVVEQGRLATVWRTLTMAGARQVIGHWERRLGAPLRATPLSLSAATQSPIYGHSRRQWKSSTGITSVWIRALAGMDAGDERVQLAAVVSGIQHCPLLLLRDAPAVVAAFTADVLPREVAKPLQDQSVAKGRMAVVAEPTSSLVAKPKATTAFDSVDNLPRDKDVTEATTRDSAFTPASDTATTSAAKHLSNQPHANEPTASPSVAADEKLAQMSPFATIASYSPQKLANSPTLAPTIEDEIETKPIANDALAGSHFYTAMGGVFYLINAMQWCLSREQMFAQVDAAGGNGWMWLYQLVRRMEKGLGDQAGNPPSLIDITLERFIAHQAGLTVAELASEAPNRIVEPLFDRLNQRFADKDFWSVADQSLLRVPAQVVATPSHIDVYFPLTQVRLAVRVAGLDVNPGWVPWLGRVVTFHYIDSPLISPMATPPLSEQAVGQIGRDSHE